MDFLRLYTTESISDRDNVLITVVALDELSVYNQLDLSSLADLYEMMW